MELFDGNLLDYEGGGCRSSARLLGDCGLKLVAAYSGGNFIFPDILDEELARIDAGGRRVAEAGGPHLVVGGGAKRAAGTQADDYKRLGAALESVAGIAEARGLRAHYHPHLTTMAETPRARSGPMFAETRIDFCPDTAHLGAAGGDPAAMVREHTDRISYVHLKGWQREPFAFTPLGEGDLDNGAVDPGAARDRLRGLDHGRARCLAGPEGRVRRRSLDFLKAAARS